MDAGRFKGYDYGVMGLFALALIGVSTSWYTVSISLGGQTVSGGVNGWHYAWGIIAFIAALVAVFVVSLKLMVGFGSSLPDWYKEGPTIMGLGDLVTLFAIIGLIDKPGRGVDVLGMFKIGYGIGVFITLVAGLLMGGCGILAMRDKPAASRGIPGSHVGMPSGTWQAGPLLADAWPGGAGLGGAQPGAGSSQYCQGCGIQLEPDSRFCRSCGRPQG